MDPDQYLKFIETMPKIELHAHLNGSLTPNTLKQLGSNENDISEYIKLEKTPIDQRTLSDCFKIFDYAHTATCNPEAVYIATRNVIEEFHKDNVIYLELRTTPRKTIMMTKDDYVEAVVRGIKDNNLINADILVKLILSINRGETLKEREENLEIILKMARKYPDVITGIDLSGNPYAGKFNDVRNLFETAKMSNLRTTIHCGEHKDDDEVKEILDFFPDRIGHAVFLHPGYGGSTKNWETLLKRQVFTEICLTSNLISGSVKNYEDHHVKEWLKHDLPFSINTDDKGAFNTTLSKEFQQAQTCFALKPHDLWKITSRSIENSFATSQEKTKLKEKLERWRNQKMEHLTHNLFS